jgi:FCP1-like phosphatase family protein
MKIEEGIVKLEFNEAKDDSFKLYFKENATVQKDRRIGEYINQLGNKIPIISEFYGRILKINEEEKIVVIEICKHEMVYKALCTSCGSPMPKTQTYISIHKEITFNEEQTRIVEESIVKKYVDEKKLILLLDLDNTILHAGSPEMSQTEYAKLKDIYGWEITYITIKGQTEPGAPLRKQNILIKFRPMLKELLQSLKNTYEIFIYTQGTIEYAKEIIKYLNENLEFEYLSIDRMVARTGFNCENKSIKKIFPTTEDMVVILDDRMDVWQENTRNLINLVPYYFFYDEKMFKIKNKYKAEEDDYILFSIERILNFINKAYYFAYENKKKTDVKLIIEKKFKSILKDITFTFSGLYPKETDIYNTRNGFLINILGGNLYEDYDEDVDIVLSREFQSI